jgi:hypothetical protein
MTVKRTTTIRVMFMIFPVRKALMRAMTASELASIMIAMKKGMQPERESWIELTPSEETMFLNPVRELPEYEGWINDMISMGNGVTLMGSDLQRLMERINDPVTYWNKPSGTDMITVWLMVREKFTTVLIDEGTEESIPSIRTVLSGAATMNRTADEGVIVNRTGILVWEVFMEWYKLPDLTVNGNDDWLSKNLKKLLVGVDEDMELCRMPYIDVNEDPKKILFSSTPRVTNERLIRDEFEATIMIPTSVSDRDVIRIRIAKPLANTDKIVTLNTVGTLGGVED